MKEQRFLKQMTKRRKLISSGQAAKYYDILKQKVDRRGCSVEEVEGVYIDASGVYYPRSYLVEIQKNRSDFIMLIVLAHELGHFIEYMTYFKHYGRNAYHRFIRKTKFRKADIVLSEANAWITAEKELNKLDKNICLDYRFPKYRSIFMDDAIKAIYQEKGNRNGL